MITKKQIGTGAPPADIQVLFVDDEANAWMPLLRTPLKSAGIQILPEVDPEVALKRIELEEPDVVLLDVLFPDSSNKQQQAGRKLLDKIRRHCPTLPVVMFTTTLADEIYKLGTDDFPGAVFVFSKSAFHEEYQEGLSPTESLVGCLKEAVKSARQLEHVEFEFKFVVGETPEMRALADYILRIANTDLPVLIYGESGTGKELIADSLHTLSDRADKPLVKVNCGALSDETLESTLFGHRKGAFTSAQNDHRGLFEQANNGTLFLDEVQTMSPRLQQSLLRAVEEGTIRQMGATQDSIVKVRVLAAANEDLNDFTQSGKFRKDLLYRLDRAKIVVPPLRDRLEDIVELFSHFVGQANKKYSRSVSTKCRKDLLQLFQSYDWPGNIRELQSLIETAVAVCKANLLTPQDFNSLTSKRSRGKDLNVLHPNDLPSASVSWSDLTWDKLKNIKGEQRKSILVSYLNGVILESGKRPTSAQLAEKLGTSPGNIRRVLHKSDIRLKDFDASRSSG